MSVPFLKKDKAGYRLLFPRSLYPRRALLKLEEMYAGQAMSARIKGRFFELKSDAWSEEDCLKVCENFLYFAKTTAGA